MNKKTVSISGFVMLFIAFFFLPANLKASSENTDNKAVLTDSEMRWRIEKLMGPFDYRYTSKVRSEVEGYVFDYRQGAEELLGRVTIYFPVFEQKLKEKNLPQEIKYLSLIESALKVNAYSRVGAAGLWQFMRGTAREYGLTVNKSIDQRYAVEESTEAALTYLSALHEQFGDWTLALAAYNCGPGNVRKAMRRSGGHDYWSIRNYLPKETRNYIPKFIAASYLMAYFYEHDLMPIRPDDYFFETLESEVFGHLSFDQISMITGTPLKVIKNLNPSYRKNFIPNNTNGMKLILPRGSMYVLLEQKDERELRLADQNNINFNAYIRSNFAPEVARYLLINQNEKIEIANVPSRDVESFMSDSRQVNEKQMSNKMAPLVRNRRNEGTSAYITYRLKSGETLKDVALRYDGVDVESILRNNKISMKQAPPPGTLLRIMKK